MSWNGSGTFSRIHDWVTDKGNAIGIVATRHDAEDDSFAAGIQACVTKNGESKFTASCSPNADASYSLGSATLKWVNAFLSGAIKFVGTSFTTSIAFTDPTADRTITLPDDDIVIIGASTTDTFTNKTFDANGTGNSLSNVDVADLANGTDGELITWDASGAPAVVAAGTATHVLTSNGAGAAPTFQAPAAGITLGTQQASTSGTSIDFTGIPAGTKRIKVMFSGVSTNGTASIIIQLGDSGGFETTGYLGNNSFFAAVTVIAAFTTGFGVTSNHVAANIVHGTATLDLENASAFTWACTSALSNSVTPSQFLGSGVKSLSSELTQLRVIASNGTDAFDAGVINISYES